MAVTREMCEGIIKDFINEIAMTPRIRALLDARTVGEAEKATGVRLTTWPEGSDTWKPETPVRFGYANDKEAFTELDGHRIKYYDHGNHRTFRRIGSV